MWNVAVVVLMIFIVVIVVAPLGFEFALTLAERFGFPWVRQSRTLFRIMAVLDKSSVAAEYGVAAATLAMILVPIYLHFWEFAPFWIESHARHHSGIHLLVWHVLPSVWINSNLLFHYFLACTVKPAEPSARDTTSRRCKTCHRPKPVRAHHCSTCNRCVDKMDHHCPFTTNCVGKGNHKYFYLFVTYAWIATLYAVWLSNHPYQECIELEDEEDHGEIHCRGWEGLKPRLFFCSVAACALLTAFWLFVTYLVYTDTTTIEFLSFAERKRLREAITTSRAPNLLHNMQGVLGPWRYWWRWLVPFKSLHDSIPEFAA